MNIQALRFVSQTTLLAIVFFIVGIAIALSLPIWFIALEDGKKWAMVLTYIFWTIVGLITLTAIYFAFIV